MKKKLLITTFALIAAIICTFGLTACNNTDDNNSGTVSAPPTAGLEYNRYYNCSAAACSGIGTATKTEIVIADNCKGKPVEYVSNSAFKDCTSITSISIPDSVYEIDNSAFYGCTSLTNIRLPGNLRTIGNSVFYGCTSLTSISLPGNLRTIENYAFYGCTLLTSINFAGTVEQWENLRKFPEWNENTGDYVIHCTDGDIEKL